MSRQLFVLLIAATSLADACASTATPGSSAPSVKTPVTDARAASGQPIVLANDFELRPLTPGVWLHVSYKDLPGVGRFPSNGLLIVGPEGALLVDTPWTREQTRQLLAWLRAFGEGRQPGDAGYPRRVFLVHGDPDAQIALEPKVQALGYATHVPHWHERVQLD